MALTAQQERFAELLAYGYSKTAAYRYAYDVAPRTKKETVHNEAYRLANHPEVAPRVEQLRSAVADRVLDGLTEYANHMRRCALRCEDADDMTGAHKFWTSYGEVLGFYAKKGDGEADQNKPATAADAFAMVNKLLDTIRERGLPVPAQYQKLVEALPAPKQAG